MRLLCLLLLAIALPVSTVQAQGTYWTYDPAWEAPVDYYASTVGLLGQDLKNELHNIIRHDYFGAPGSLHRFVAYGDAPPALDRLDQAGPGPAPFAPWEINLVFDNINVLVTDTVDKNREHVWPASRQQLSPPRNDLGRDYADLHALRWILASTNSARSNLNFGGDRPDGTAGPSGAYWYPGDAHKGQVARMLFYMAVRYDGSEPNTENLTLVNGNPLAWNALHGDLEKLLQWHVENPPDAFELRRNHLIFSPTYVNEFGQTVTNNFYQGNRNPFIDNPDWAIEIFAGGSAANNSQIFVGDSPDADGSSSVTVDFGRVMVGSAPTSEDITVTKTGSDSTTFTISATGTTTNPTGSQAFAPGDQTLELTINSPSAATAGAKTGTVTIQNEALTSGGSGLGSQDANDTIAVTLTAVNKRSISNPAAPIDLGTVIVGGQVTPAGPASITSSGTNNTTTSVAVEMTAGPNIDGIEVVGGTGAAFVGSGRGEAISRTLGGTFLSAGDIVGSIQLPVSTLENGGLGLPGEGAYAPVSIAYTGTALDHAQPSFASDAALSTLDLDLGSFAPGSGFQTLGFDIFNRFATLGFTAALDIDGVTGSGDTTVLATDLLPVSGVAAGSNAAFLASLDTTDSGLFEAQYTIAVSDEDLPGGISLPSLTLNLSGYVAIAGDLNLDRSVDDDDLAVLQANLGQAGGWGDGDFSGTGTVSLYDAYLLFTNYGTSLPAPTSISPIPEPGSLALITLGSLMLLSRRRPASAHG